jgi:long-subunit fatty acid transport protein
MRARRAYGGAVGVLCFLGSLAAGASELESSLPGVARLDAQGGTVQGSSRGAAALFGNPAGLADLEGVEAIAGLSGTLSFSRGVPGGGFANSSSTSSFLLPSVAVAARLADVFRLGLGFVPRGSFGAAYDGPPHTSRARATSDYEIAPSLAFVVPEELVSGRLSLGASYRLSWAERSFRDTGTDLGLTGFDGRAVRLGLQYSPLPELRLGATFENATSIGLSADSGTYAGSGVVLASTTRQLPYRVGAGARFDLDRYGVALDYSFVGSGDLDRQRLTVQNGGGVSDLVTELAYSPGHIVRAGFEGRLPFGVDELGLRAGYVLQTPLVNPAFPDSYTLAPAAAHTITLGGGYQAREFQVNVAVFSRFSRAVVSADELGSGCSSCGGAGTYQTVTLGASLDFSAHFEP